MRPKETYTKEEYQLLQNQLNALREKYLHVCTQYEIAKSYIQFIYQRDGGKMISEIQHVIAEENKKLEIKKLFVKYPYYKILNDYVKFGITDIKTLMQLTGKSKSTVYRALHHMDLLPLEKIDVSKGKLNL